MNLKVTILGCGNSAGTPTIGNHWGQCDPANPRNRRTRPALAVQSENTTIIIDSGPDIRDQINREDIRTVDAVLYTHAHGDHINGIDDLRVLFLRTKKLVNIYGAQVHIDEISQRFSYLFNEREEIYPKVINPHIIAAGTHRIGDIDLTAFEQDHGTCMSLGYRFGDLAYSTDVVALNEQALDALKGIKTWIVDAAGYKMEQNLVHFTLRQIYALNETIGAEKVYLTHLTPSMDYESLRKELKNGYEPAYDGLVLEITS